MTSLQEIRMTASKCTIVIGQGTGVYFAKDLIGTVPATNFRIIPDETTYVYPQSAVSLISVLLRTPVLKDIQCNKAFF